MAHDLTVCVCTHNGQATIGGCLESLAAQDLACDRSSLLVIDDGSTDGTAVLVRQWQRDHPGLNCRLISQAQAGLSAARNAGLQNADAPIVAYIDDDAYACPGWLNGIWNAFQIFPSAGAVGGRVIVRWPQGKPPWWHDDLDEVFNRFCPAEEPTTLDFPQLPYGCNFAVRREVAIRLGGFRTDLGRRNGTLLGGEETDLLLRVIEAGHQIAYWPDALVEHLAPPHRASRRYILKRAWNHGRSLARVAAAHPRIAEAIPTLPTCLCRMICHAPKHRLRLAHWKYWLLRFGYHFEAHRLAKISGSPDPSSATSAEVAHHA
jgi:glycosyltransferase involved in cell wall biosynthesis